jgi:hypothetical protein
MKLVNYWGYNTLGFFAPEARFGPDNPLDAFRTTVARLHDAGIEVILDVVYNHTAEGNHLGPTLSFRGIDNQAYYRLMPEDPRFYLDFTGTGNTLNLLHPRTLQMVVAVEHLDIARPALVRDAPDCSDQREMLRVGRDPEELPRLEVDGDLDRKACVPVEPLRRTH